MSAKRLFISDVHLNAQRFYDQGVSRYRPQDHRNRLVNFLQHRVLEKAKQVKDVVLLGDIFDTWTCPPDEDPPTYAEIFAGNPDELELFRRIIAADTNLFYVRGNHDFDLEASELQQAVPGIRVIKSYLGAGRSHAEHGHEQTFFNAVDFRSDPAFGRPIGYFIARAATKVFGHGSSFANILSYMDDVVEMVATPQTLPTSVIEAITERAGMNLTDSFKMPDGGTITVGEIKHRYANLADSYGPKANHRLYDELTQLGRTADRLCSHRSYNVVVFGHTHNAQLDKDSILVEDRIYANSGTWCEKEAHCVEIDKGPLSKTLTVRLHRIRDDGSIAHTKMERLTKN